MSTTWITFAYPPLESPEQFDVLVEQLGGNPAGLVERYVGTAEDGRICAVSMWASKADADRFFSDEFYAELLGAALTVALGRDPGGGPQTIGMDPARHWILPG